MCDVSIYWLAPVIAFAGIGAFCVLLVLFALVIVTIEQDHTKPPYNLRDQDSGILPPGGWQR